MDSKIASLGLDPETAAKVEAVFKDILKDSYVPIARFNEINESKKKLETTVSERDAQLEELGKSQGVTEDLKKEIQKLQASNIEAQKKYDLSIKQMKTDKYINDVLMENGVLDPKFIPAVKAYLPNVDIDNDDSKTVFITKLGEVKTTMLPTMFKSENTPKASIEGFHMSEPSNTASTVKDDGSYESYLKIHGYID